MKIHNYTCRRIEMALFTTELCESTIYGIFQVSNRLLVLPNL